MNHAFAVTSKLLRSASKEVTSRQIPRSCSPVRHTAGLYNLQNVGRHFMTAPLRRQLCGLYTSIGDHSTFHCSTNAFQTPRQYGYATKAGPSRGKNRLSHSSKDVRRLSPSEIVKVFGRSTDVAIGNNLLQTLQSQRMLGTLDSMIEQPEVTPDMVNRGLAFLRESYPLDEDAAIMRRIQKEEDEKERAALAEVEKAKDWTPQESTAEDGIYGKSKVDEAVKKYNKRMEMKAEERQKREQQELENTQVVFEYHFVAKDGEVMRRIDEVHVTQRGNRTVRTIKNTSFAPRGQDPEEQLQKLTNESSVPGLIQAPNGMAIMQNRSERTKKENPWRHKWAKHAQLSNWDGVSEPPHMPWVRRWGLPTLFMLVTLGASILFAESYKPPSRSARLFPDVPPAASTILAIIAVNVAVFMMWKFPPLWRFMNKHMLVHAVIPKPSQLLGNIVSHQRIGHLAINMFVLWWMGTSLCEEIGRGKFMALYVSGGVFAAWLSLAQALATKHYLQASLGASGAFCCVIACWLRLREGQKVEWALWPGEWKPNLQADRFLIILIVTDVVGALYYWRTGAGMVDHMCHLGGFLAGIGWSELLKKDRRMRQKDRSRTRA